MKKGPADKSINREGEILLIMFHIKICSIKFLFIFISYFSLLTLTHSAEKSVSEPGLSDGKKGKIANFFISPISSSINPIASSHKFSRIVTGPSLPKATSPSQFLQESSEPTQCKGKLKRLSESTNPPKRKKEIESEMKVQFLCGTDDHIEAYSTCIDRAESQIIIASWNINFIPEEIFSSLLAAKKRGVCISFVVNSVKRERTLNYFYDERDDESIFSLFKTKSHAKFLFVDSTSLILGSYNALGESFEETNDASFMLEGSIKQLWPFYMSIYETYISIGEELGDIFGGIAGVSKAKNPQERPLLQRHFDDGSQIFLLRTLKEHENFFTQATPHNGKVTIYSPFSTKDNTLRRLQTLEKILPVGTELNLKVLKKFEKGLIRLLSSVPTLRSHARIQITPSHQKIVILGDQTICVGSLNWLSAAQDEKDPFKNVELSIVLQGFKAEEIIKSYYNS